jgi:hypothetical protein
MFDIRYSMFGATSLLLSLSLSLNPHLQINQSISQSVNHPINHPTCPLYLSVDRSLAGQSIIQPCLPAPNVRQAGTQSLTKPAFCRKNGSFNQSHRQSDNQSISQSTQPQSPKTVLLSLNTAHQSI